MTEEIERSEVRIIIKATEGPRDRLVEASIFVGVFKSIFDAIKVANKETNGKKHQSEFFISHLRMGSNEVGLLERPRSVGTSPAIDLFRNAAIGATRSEFELLDDHPKLATSIEKICQKIGERYDVVAKFPSGDLHIDGFLASQIKRHRENIRSEKAEPNFVGNAIGAFLGVLGQIDYRGETWKGALILPGGNAQIECTFDKNAGEDAYNKYGNKRVSVTGRAIYTSDSQLPQRLEVMEIEEIPPVEEFISFRGVLTGKHYFDWDGSGEDLQ